MLSSTDLARLSLEVCLRAKQSHGDSVIPSHMQRLYHSAEMAVLAAGNLVTHLRMNMMLYCTQTSKCRNNGA